MNKNIWLVVTILLFGSFVWYSNGQMKEMQGSLEAVRAEALVASKKAPQNTTTILTQKTIERFKEGKTVDSSPGVSAPPPPEYDPIESRRQAEENADHLQQIVFSEPADPVWDAKAQVEIQAMDEQFPKSKVKTVECRKTMCFVEVAHDDLQANRLWDAHSTMNPETLFKKRLTIRFDGPNGEMTSKIFLVREGNDLPAIN